MIDRTFVGKEYPPFPAEIDADLGPQLEQLFEKIASKDDDPSTDSTSDYPSHLSLLWPAILTLRATAGLLTVWEDMGVDPMNVRLVREEFEHRKKPEEGDTLTGKVTVEDIVEWVDPEVGIEDQIELRVEFADGLGLPVATYGCTFRSSVLGTMK